MWALLWGHLVWMPVKVRQVWEVPIQDQGWLKIDPNQIRTGRDFIAKNPAIIKKCVCAQMVLISSVAWIGIKLRHMKIQCGGEEEGEGMLDGKKNAIMCVWENWSSLCIHWIDKRCCWRKEGFFFFNKIILFTYSMIIFNYFFLIWKWCLSSVFPSKSFYRTLVGMFEARLSSVLVWKGLAPPRVEASVG